MHESKQMQWSCQLDEDDIIPENIQGTLSNVCSSEENNFMINAAVPEILEISQFDKEEKSFKDQKVEISKTCAGD